MSSLSQPGTHRGIKPRYCPLGLVAQGQFGRVYCAVHRASGQLVALKAIDAQRSTTSQFLRELSSLVSLRHPNLTGLRAIEHTDRGRYLVLDYAAGGTLRQLMEAETRPRLPLLLHCLLDVLNGLAHAHDRGIVHCDVKPENILLDVTPGGWRASLTDFGIAQSHGQSVDVSLEQGGSPAYMAPERFSGQAYPASDLYGVGIMLYEILLGDRPFHGRPSELRQAHLHQAIAWSEVWPEGLDFGWRSLLTQALAKEAQQRPSSARTMAQALAQQLALLENRPSDRPGKRTGAALSRGFFRPLAAVAQLPWPAVRPCSWGRETRAIAPRPAASPGGESGLWLVQRCQLLAYPWAATGPGPSDSTGPSQLGLPPPIRFPAPVTQVVGLPGGGVATTAQALYHWSEPRAKTADGPDAGPEQDRFQPVQRFRPLEQPVSGEQPVSLDCWLAGEQPLGPLALAPDGSWGAVLARSPEGSRLVLFRPPSAQAGREESSPLPELRQLDCAPGQAPEALVILDRRHGVTLVQSGPGPGNGPGNGPCRLALFNRRGHWLAQFSLPVALRHCVRGQHPYELWAIEAQQPQTLLRIQLRPFRLERLPLAIAPQLIQPQSWGCLLANGTGQLLVVDRSGQGLGQLQVPLGGDQRLQEVWAVGDRGLALSLSAPEGLSLYQLDWTALALPLIF